MINNLYKVFDASRPPAKAPPGAEGVLGYVGQRGETPHIWTPDEWQPFSHLRQFPCWVPDTTANPAKDAAAAVDAVRALGWAVMPGAEQRAIILDGETRQFSGWYESWANEIVADGFWPVAYGSLHYVDGQFARSVWAADWDGIPILAPGETVGGTQYGANTTWEGTEIDLSVINGAMFARGGIGPRKG